MKNNIVSAACTPAGLGQELLAAQSWALLSAHGPEDGAAPEPRPGWAGGPPEPPVPVSSCHPQPRFSATQGSSSLLAWPRRGEPDHCNLAREGSSAESGLRSIDPAVIKS